MIDKQHRIKILTVLVLYAGSCNQSQRRPVMKKPHHSNANQTLSVMTFDVIRVQVRDVNMPMAWPQPTPPPQARRSPQNNRHACAFLRSQVLSARVARPEFLTPAAL